MKKKKKSLPKCFRDACEAREYEVYDTASVHAAAASAVISINNSSASSYRNNNITASIGDQK